MSHDKNTQSDVHREVALAVDTAHHTREDYPIARQYYLTLAKDWVDPFPDPVVDEVNGILVVREDILDVGSKARFGDLLVQSVPKNQPLVYVAPRYGFAAISLAYLARLHGRRLVLFMPACKRISDHQMVAIEMGAEVQFARIAAMPNLNLLAKKWAEKNNGYFIPLGLKHELVTAAIVKTATRLTRRWGCEPAQFWTAVSTGVLNRALQIAWPQALSCGVTVSRNIQDGEKGEAVLFPHPREFARDAGCVPPFPSASNYDAKCWELMMHYDTEGAVFWNVAGNIKPQDPNLWKSIDSERGWGEYNA